MQHSNSHSWSIQREQSRWRLHLLGAAAALALAGPAASQTPASSPLAPTLKCRSIPDAQARLACFDSAAGELAAGVSRGDVVIVRRERVEEARRSTFGLPEAAATAAVVSAATDESGIAATGGAPAPTAKAPPPPAMIDTISQTIREVVERNLDLYQLTLEDGSVWRTTEAIPTFMPRAGETLTIRRGSLGSFLARTDRSRQVRIQRIR